LQIVIRLLNFVSSFLLIFVSISYSTDYWIPVPSPTSKWLYRLSFADTSKGWAVGDSGIVLHTTDGGLTWQIQNTNVESFIWGVSFPSAAGGRLGWAVTFESFPFTGSKILTTTNGGSSWTYYAFPDTTVELLAINFLDSLNGWTAGSQGKIFHTTNGGLTWIPHPIDSFGCGGLFPIWRMGLDNTTLRFAVGGVIDFAGVAWHSTDFGYHWKSTCVGPEPVYDVFLFDSLNAICSGGDYEFGVTTTRTSDGGQTWLYDTTGAFGKGETIEFRTPAEGWIGCGFSGRLLLSLDTGRSWTTMFSPDTSAIYDIVFTTPYHGIAVGYDPLNYRGTIFRYNTEVIGIQNHNQYLPDKFLLSQNFPNPFNSSTVITYYVPTSSAEVIARIYDAAGRLVREFWEGIKMPGRYQLKINEPGLSSGIYFLSVIFHSHTAHVTKTQKIVLIK